MTPEQVAQAFKARLQGMTWARLATQYNTTPQALQQELADYVASEQPATTSEEIARLDLMQAGLWNDALNGNPETAAEIREIIALRHEITPKTTRIARIWAEYD